MPKLVIRNARTRQRPAELVDIAIEEGKIVAIGSGLERGDEELDARGGLVTESFVDPHLHLCKVYTFHMVGEGALAQYQGGAMGGAMSAIELAAAVKAEYREDWIYRNARRALLDGLRYGVTHVQAFVDVDTKARLEAARAVLRLRDELAPAVQVKVVAFPQDGLLRDPGAADYVREAIQLGADVVGGIPWIEYTDEAMREHVEWAFDLARETGRPVAMLVDDAGDPGLRTTELLATAALRYGWQGRVTACHARAMALYPEPYFRKLAVLARQADLRFVVDPHTGPLYARAFDLLDAGVVVALGQDDIVDAYYPYGRHNMLEVAFLASHLMWAMTPPAMERLYDMVTTLAARAMGVEGHRLAVGAPANLVVLEAESVHEAILEHAPPRYVIANGRLVAENASSSTLFV
uniref:Cytosine deaminase n=1 Tax=Thermorudis sp. TaxID=1969470 RepID=A0A7C2W8B4_9BACT